MASLKFMLGMFPATSKIEQQEAALIKDYEDFKAYSTSPELKRLQELEQEVTTSDFKAKVKQIKQEKFKDTKEYRKEQRYKTLKKSKEIKTWKKVKDSPALRTYQDFSTSGTLKKYQELEQYIRSDQFKEAKRNADPKEFKDTEAGQKEAEFHQLHKSPDIKKYFKFENSKDYKIYDSIEGSDIMKEYLELEAFMDSEEFKKVKEYMALSPQKKYEQSKEYTLEKEYLDLKNSDKHKWYEKIKVKNDFDKLQQWDLKFEENFDQHKLDEKKWMTRFFWGDVLLKDSYVLPDDKHIFTDGKNLEFKDTILRIVTKKEQARGKVWNPAMGFIEKEFNYTSDLISTGKSFRQQYGLFKAKVRISGAPIKQAFWMVAEKILPHVDVFKVEKNKLYLGNFWGNIKEKNGVHKKIFKASANRFSKDFFIYSLEWSPNKLEWKINDVPVFSQTQGIPAEPMYMIFSAGVSNGIADHQLPAGMEIDWLKVYSPKAETE